MTGPFTAMAEWRYKRVMTKPDPVAYLADQWGLLMQAAQPSKHDEILCFGDIVTLYSHGRFYHDLTHLVDLLEQAETLTFNDPVSVKLAVFYHDAVYGDTVRMLLNTPAAEIGLSNEELSARLALEHLTVLGFDEATRNRAAELIRMTQNHQCDPADHDGALFLDMDMSILGSAPDRYDAYAFQIPQEYASVDSATFCAARLNFLNKTLAHGRVFITDHYHQQLGAQARQNMEREKRHLEMTGRPLGKKFNPPGSPALQP